MPTIKPNSCHRTGAGLGATLIGQGITVSTPCVAPNIERSRPQDGPLTARMSLVGPLPPLAQLSPVADPGHVIARIANGAQRAARASPLRVLAVSACRSLIALLCSTFISHGTSIPQTFKYAAGDSRRTRLNISCPCRCQSSAISSRKRLLNARRVLSGEPPGWNKKPRRSGPRTFPGMKVDAPIGAVFGNVP